MIDYEKAFDELLSVCSYAMEDLGYQSSRDWIEDCVDSWHHQHLYEILVERGLIEE